MLPLPRHDGDDVRRWLRGPSRGERLPLPRAVERMGKTEAEVLDLCNLGLLKWERLDDVIYVYVRPLLLAGR